MRALAIGLICLAACKGNDTKTTPTTPVVVGNAPVTVPAVVPKVDAIDATIATAPNDLATVFVAADGKLTLGASLHGAVEDRRELDADYLGKLVRESVAMGRDLKDAIAQIEQGPQGPKTTITDDDPPPPEEDDSDTSGGTGTAMALEEGKMGPPDSQRAEGQYKMKKSTDPVGPAAIEVGRIGGAFVALTGTGPEELARNGIVVGARLPAIHKHLPAIVAADPKAKAGAVVDAIEASTGSIAVEVGGEVRVLRVQFFGGDDHRYHTPLVERPWIEVRATAAEIVFEVVPAVPTKSTWAATDIAAAYKAAMANPKFAEGGDLEVLVGDDVDAQHLVDLIVALDRAGAPTIALGHMFAKDNPQWKLRGKTIHETAPGTPSATGDLDKALIRRVVKSAHDKIAWCYEKALLDKPNLTGTVTVQFTISAKGNVASAKADGVDPGAAKCIAEIVKTLVFPAPKGGGVVQVSYPFVLRTR